MAFYLRTYSGTAPQLAILEEGADASLVAATCRRAALEFLRGVRHGWEARDLAAWLTGPYAGATGYLPRGECVAFVDGASARSGASSACDDEAAAPSEAPEDHDDDPQRVDSVLWSARSSVLASLEDAQSPGARLAFVRSAIRRRDIVSAVAVSGGSLWIPLDRRKMHLRERVLSLFAVDFLLRPQDYVGELLVCSMCESVVFDPAARELGQCGAHRSSGFVEKQSAVSDHRSDKESLG